MIDRLGIEPTQTANDRGGFNSFSISIMIFSTYRIALPAFHPGISCFYSTLFLQITPVLPVKLISIGTVSFGQVG